MFKRDKDRDRRCRQVTSGTRGDGPVVYWMDRDQRGADNWALLWAQQEALINEKRLEVIYCYDPSVKTARQAIFELEGLRELQQMLLQYNIDFHLLTGVPVETIPLYLKSCGCHALITDFSPLRPKRNLLEKLIKLLSVPIYEVDSHNIIPVWITSEKKEYGAYTIRPKVNRLLDEYLTDFPLLEVCQKKNLRGAEAIDVSSLVSQAAVQHAGRLSWLVPGEQEAHKAMRRVLDRLHTYADHRNDPTRNGQSNMSPYLHFGQLSPQRLALEVRTSGVPVESRDSYLEELIVRRELADNYCFYEPYYDHFMGFPEWAQRTLEEHRHDQRDYLYSYDELEQARTHESLWNGCQRDLLCRGKLHGYLRMYWAKKILEWTSSPEEALAYTIKLNDTYSIDGFDPNGYTGIAWSIGGVHDRAWRERPVFGKIRYMNESGCRRKFDTACYLEQVGSYM